MRILTRLFGRATAGEAVLPLAMLSGLYFFDEFDTAAFGVLTPNIQRAFGLDDNGIVGLVVLNVAVTAMLAIPLGYYADRTRRVPITVISGVLAGAFSLMTGLVGSVALLTVARVGNGVGLLANGPVHNSLLADYYTPRARPGVFANHNNAAFAGAVVGPALAGALGATLGWRAVFLVLFIPIVVVSLLALRLPEPVRGGTDDPESAEVLDAERPMAFKEAWRTLLRVRTLKFQFWAMGLFGAGFIPIVTYLNLYYEREFHVGAFGRGLITATAAAVTLVGVNRGGRVTPRLVARGMQWPLRAAGAALGWYGLSLVVIVLSPWLAMSVAAALVGSLGVGFFFAPFYATQALVSPARARSLSFSLTQVFIVVGGVAFFVLGLGKIADQHGIRMGIAVGIPFWVGASAVLMSIGRFVADDASRALASLAITVEARRKAASAEGEHALLRVDSLDVAYGSVQVLFGVDLTVHEGEIVALLGTNGAGKSTLLKAISGLLDPVAGTVIFNGGETTHAGAAQAVRAGIVQMPGGRAVFPTLTVRECLRLAGTTYKRTDPEHVARATAQVLEYFPILAERKDQLAGDLSGGEQQMLGLAMAFIAKPKLLMIDELSLGLAPVIVGQLVDIVRRIHADGTTIILVEQSVNVALTLAERAVFMEKGQVRFEGPTAELLERNDILRSVFLEGAGAASADAPKQRTASRRPILDGPPDLQQPVLVSARGVGISFGGIRAVNDVSFDLRRGEIVGIIGPNGAGKTTLFDLLSGHLPLGSGSVELLGRDVSTWSPDRRAMAGLGRSFQDARLFPSMTVAENLALAFERFLPTRDTLAAVLGMPAVAEQEHLLALSVDDLVDLLGLSAFRNKFVSELSTGSRRVVDIGMCLAHRPEVLILDEPSSGIAQRETEALGPLLRRIHDELGCSLLVIEHDMPLLLAISDRLLALETGRLIADGRPDDVINDPRVVASYLDTDETVINRSGPMAAVRP